MQIFELFGSILLKDAGVSKQLDDIDKKGSETSKSMGLSFGSIAGAALKLGAVLGVGLGIKEMITSAAKGQVTMAQMDAVLKSTHGSAGMTKTALVDLASSLSKTTTFSAGTTKAAENLLLTFTGISSKTFPDTIKAAQNMSTAMGTDLNSSVMTLGKALNDPVAGMTKLTKQGVTFTQQQKDQVKAMVAAGDTAGAQKIILAELSKEFGGSAEAAGKTFNGQVTILKNGLIGMGASIGSTVIPYLTQFMTAVNTNMPKIKQVITDVVTVVADKFKTWITIIGQIAKELLPNIGSGIETAKGKTSGFSGVLDIVTKALSAIRDNIGFVKVALGLLGVAWLAHEGYILVTNAALLIHNGIVIAKNVLSALETAQIWLLIASDVAYSAATTIATAATTAFGAVMAVVTSPIFLVIAALVLLGVGIYEIVTHWDVIKAKTLEVWATIKDFLSTTWDSIKTTVTSVFTSIKTFLNDTWESIKTSTTNLWNGIKDFFKTLWDRIKTIFTDVIKAIVSFVTDTFNTLSNTVNTIFNTLKDFFTTVWDAIKTVFLGVILLILDLVTGNFTKLKEDANNIFNKLKADFKQIWDDIKTIFSTVIKLIVDFCKMEWNGLVTIGKTIFNVFKDFLSGLWNAIKTTTTTVWTAIKEGITNLIKDTIEGAKAAWNAFKQFLVDLWNAIKNTASTAWNALKTTVVDLCKAIIDGVKTVWNELLTWFRELPGKLKTIGSDMFTSMKNGISSVIGTIKTTVVEGVTKAIDWLKALPGQAVTWGKDFIQGFVDGITSKANALLKSVENIANSIRGMLHFSTPDYGPLADYETWMPDFMEGMAKGIDTNKFKVIDSIKNLTSDMKVNASVVGGVTAKGENTSVVAGNDKSKSDVYVSITSPTAISPSEVARQLRRVQRELALEF
ncbi:phage tail length tape measure family protein [Clostridium estertheticum]|uniref:phage tail protein n=1 Tax=Clostridium estertheticum TaxID=238834 RepID=UPI001C0BB33B|nr:phage tail length tape measure family protein [Clostridium estertheticum]MBU3176095.1 phage tail length tape measure family protein [Clostridium estertheticum]